MGKESHFSPKMSHLVIQRIRYEAIHHHASRLYRTLEMRDEHRGAVGQRLKHMIRVSENKLKTGIFQ